MSILVRSVKGILRFLFPEIQLFQLIRKNGFFAPKESASPPNQNREASQSAQANDQQRYTRVSAGRDTAADYSPPSGAGNVSPPPSGYSGVQSTASGVPAPPSSASTAKLSFTQIEEIFRAAATKMNGRVIGQQSLVTELIAAYTQGYIHEREGQARNAILLAGTAGTGKMTALELLVREMHAHKLSSRGQAADIDLSRYEADEISGNFIRDMSAAFQEAEGTVIFRGFKEADSSILGFIGQLATEGSFRNKEGVRISAANYFLVFYLDYPIAEREEHGRIPAALTGQIPVSILQGIRTAAISLTLDDRSVAQIAEYLMKKAAESLSEQAQISIDVTPSVLHALAGMATMNRTFGEAIQLWIDKELVPAVTGMRARNEIHLHERVTIQFENDSFFVKTPSIEVPIRAQSFVRTESIDDVLQELQQLTGLETVKTFMKELLETVQINQRRTREGHNTVTMALHMVFTGNPGTGKTTVARLVSRILKAMGLLSHGQLVEVARQDLVGQYVGSTAPKTMAKINEAIGGVLFIDEAYTLARNDHDTFGLEAIDTIVKGMEDHRDNLVVIIAGYTQEMETFLRSNPGLRSRFPFIVEFPDYTPVDMLEILLRMANSNGFAIEQNAHEGLLELFEQRQIPGRNDSGNGRLVRNLFEESVRKQSVRLGRLSSNEANLQLLTGDDFGIGAKEAFNIEKELATIVGLDKVKSFVRALEKQLIVDRRRKEAGIHVDTGQTINMIFSGNPGTGKTTMARLLAGMLRSMGYLKKGHLVEVDRSDLVAEYVGHTANKTKIVVESALGGVLFIDEAYALAQDGVQGGGFGKEAIDTLVRLIELHKDNLVVILAGYTEDMEKFVRVNPGMSSRFPLQIEFPDYTANEMERIASIMIKSRGFVIDSNVSELLRMYFDKKQVSGKKDIGNGRLVRNTLEGAIRKQAERLAEHPEIASDKLNELIAVDFGIVEEVSSAGDTVNALGALNEVVGQASVKDFVRSLSAQIEVAKRRQELGLQKASAQTLHMIFKGNPGTGKTTIARILARRLKELGAIKTDILIETDRSGLVAGYVGQTALKTKEVIERALGGVLFVDEAYALAEGDQYGKEAIDTLVKAMDDYRDRLVVILAGYDQDMERFLDQNAGLRSRFPNIITFSDYSLEELLQISHIMVESQGYVMVQEAKNKLRGILAGYHGHMSAGNGRLVRNLVEKAIRIHAMRLSAKAEATAEELSTITAEDFVE
ncbi:Holliday junction ATP-dependent DNA helicase RuvB [Paenibacillus plantiphilus]|uniref:Holliday junction ATP-dependent DNA helicase RuvB n=1 Tax=Paenibacillus plantiphilus TaxID=2905650 RepID=A0ABN8G6H3_9BACL|nr:AAA family ATPase [Paenibacillus plantiphilus]CAH1201558.1 Holliday junction ATP-dependent DNA helicase RuvB [Paenibacillus plantiphilus]